VFFAIHDPTTLNRQGNDVGSQYRSVIFYHDDFQKVTAFEVFHEIENSQLFDAPLVTEISSLPAYYVAESYHQNYFLNHPEQGYCAFVVSPKVNKFRKQFFDLLKA
jgi:peptide-methionine (S)-S-oxide reductase